jgi:hypothetical protein
MLGESEDKKKPSLLQLRRHPALRPAGKVAAPQNEKTSNINRRFFKEIEFAM